MAANNEISSSSTETEMAMEQAVADGKVRSIGLSNWYIKEGTLIGLKVL